MNILKNKATVYMLIFCLGVFLGISIDYAFRRPHTQPVVIREDSPVNKYINPILYTETDKNEYPEYATLEKKINEYIASTTSQGNANKVSIYFKDLNSTGWTGVNEDEKFNPGSMLKVAVLIGYLKQAEIDPSVMSKKLLYTMTIDPGQYYKPTNQLTTGSYTVEQLISAMILQSDNEATKVLVENNHDLYAQAENELRLPKAIDNPNVVDFMSPKQYSSLFRVLYNSTYLSRSVSDQVLRLLSGTVFDKGLVAGLPKGTVVAHKFGEHTETLNGEVTSRELHDCGIVYFPEKPYFVCVMTKGMDFSKLESVISGASKLIYDTVGGKS